MFDWLWAFTKFLASRVRYQVGKSVHGNQVRNLPYVFFIGFNRTATRAFHELFLSHGIPSVHWDKNRIVKKMLKNIYSGKRILSGYDSRFVVFSDLILSNTRIWIEGNQFFRELYRDYPGALFVLNTRPTSDWIRSRESQKDGQNLKRQLLLLQSTDPQMAIEHWRRQKLSHEAQVRDFFKDKPGQFLELDIDSPDVVGQLSSKLPFLLDEAKWKVVGKSSHGPTF